MNLTNFRAAVLALGRIDRERSEAAGVSTRTITRWLSGDYPRLSEIVASPAAHILKPALGQDLIANGHDKAA